VLHPASEQAKIATARRGESGFDRLQDAIYEIPGPFVDLSAEQKTFQHGSREVRVWVCAD
jgi:hypothetical protein